MDTRNKLASRIDSLADKLIKARQDSVADFGDIEHRLELVMEYQGVEYINDSKATDLGATEYSLEYLQKPIVWIVGASELEEDYTSLRKLVTYKVLGIIAVGSNCEKISRALSDYSDFFVDTDSYEEAVMLAHSLTHGGETVLFSPATASFPAYNNFKERGEDFRRLVHRLDTPEGHYHQEIY